MTDANGAEDAPLDNTGFRVAPVFRSTPYTSTITALEGVLAAIDLMVGDFPSAEGIDLILVRDELLSIGARLVSLDEQYRKRVAEGQPVLFMVRTAFDRIGCG